MKQLAFARFTSSTSLREHGGDTRFARRRRRRPLSSRAPLHLVLRSDRATGRRSLLRHRALIEAVLRKAASRFGIRIYEKAIVSNHIHLLIRGHHREDIQNFTRVFAGHVAQQILELVPLTPEERGAPSGSPGAPGAAGNREASKAPGGHGMRPPPPRKRENKFWEMRIYSRLVTWGREFRAVRKYVIRNVLEALRLIPYTPRKKMARAHPPRGAPGGAGGARGSRGDV